MPSGEACARTGGYAAGGARVSTKLYSPRADVQRAEDTLCVSLCVSLSRPFSLVTSLVWSLFRKPTSCEVCVVLHTKHESTSGDDRRHDIVSEVECAEEYISCRLANQTVLPG